MTEQQRPRQGDMRAWAKEAKNKAGELRSSAQRVAQGLFRSGDLRDFLDILCRLNSYDAYNLLLILQQYPKATCLAGFKLWQRLLGDENAQVLKPEWRGKGIDLIAPYTDVTGKDQYTLTWYAVKQFDISQTNLDTYESAPSVYIQDEGHLRIIEECAVHVISTEHHRSVLRVHSDQTLRAAGLVGSMNDFTIQYREDVRAVNRIRFLCECLSQLSMEPYITMTAPQKDLASQCVIYCLFRIWGITPSRPFLQNHAILSSVRRDDQIAFLSLIQRTVRTLEESISAAYLDMRREGDLPDIP